MVINHNSIHAVSNEARFASDIVRPLYNTYCFSNITGTIAKSFGINTSMKKLPNDTLPFHNKTYDKVILFFMDGFAWRFFQQFSHLPFFEKIKQKSIISKITSQFPSTTAAHTATIHTGMEIGKHGIHEWIYYEPVFDNVISPLFYSYAGEKDRASLLKYKHIKPEKIYPTENFYNMLKENGIQSHTFHFKDYATSPYSKIALKGSKVHTFEDFRLGLEDLTQQIKNDKNLRTYYFFYHDYLDHKAHVYGPNSDEYKNAVEETYDAMLEIFYKPISNCDNNILFLQTADHGQIEGNKTNTIYLNIIYPELLNYVKTNKYNEKILFGGSPRDIFLYIKDEFLEKVNHELKEKLKGKADVFLTEFLIKEKFFGSGDISDVFRKRLGNLIILPHRHETVYWFEKDKFEQHNQSHHGGLSPEEMESIFIAMEM